MYEKCEKFVLGLNRKVSACKSISCVRYLNRCTASPMYILYQQYEKISLKELRNYKRKFFCVSATTNILKLLFFTINLHFVTWNQTSTYWKLNLNLTSSIYFVFLTSRNAKKNRTDQNISRVFLLCLKINVTQTFKSGNCNNPFLRCLCFGATYFDKYFLSYVITGRQP